MLLLPLLPPLLLLLLLLPWCRCYSFLYSGGACAVTPHS
jgi:hypothetical protein